MIWIVRISIRSLMWMLHYKSLTWDWIWNKFEFDRGENVELVSLKEEEKDMKNTIIGDELSTVFRWITLMIKPKLFTHLSFGHHKKPSNPLWRLPFWIDRKSWDFASTRGGGPFAFSTFGQFFQNIICLGTVHKKWWWINEMMK